MLIQNKIIVALLSLHTVFAWLAPERCEQSSINVRRSLDPNVSPPIVTNIDEIASHQNQNLIDTYKNYNFYSVPVSGEVSEMANDYVMFAPNKCKFYTYAPSLISSTYCQDGVSCQLSRTVTTTNSYTASEGYNWGVKVSAKWTIIPNVFDAGGEVSAGGTYSCSYTKSKSTADNVQCSVSSGGGKTLQLYTVKSDLMCQISNISMEQDNRKATPPYQSDSPVTELLYRYAEAPDDYFSLDEVEEIKKSTINFNLKGNPDFPHRLLDLDKISDALLLKMKKYFIHYNPYTDLLELKRFRAPRVWYYKESSDVAGYQKVIPFTNENGDSVYQYACVHT